MVMLNETHDADRRSWVDGADDPEADFPLQNLPFGVFRRPGDDGARCGIAIGEAIFSPSDHVDLYSGAARAAAAACGEGDLAVLMALGPSAWSALRLGTFRMLSAGSAQQSRIAPTLLSQEEVAMELPVRIGNFTDFFASIFHASNAGRLMRREDPLFPNYRYVPVAYHGRASSIVASGTPIRRPKGQIRTRGSDTPSYLPSGKLDFEAEMGMVIGTESRLGEPVPVSQAGAHIFGMCIVNDWSARDIQAWEAQPLGPFLGKSFATTISPWIVTMEALEPFRIPAFGRAEDDPAPLPHLADAEDRMRGGIAVTIETAIRTPVMAAAGLPPQVISRGSLADAYWTLAQMVAHQTSNGCNLQVGDLLATGTLSGPEPESWGSMLERSDGGRQPVALANGENRAWLEDGDEIVMRARCGRAGYRSIGFGAAQGEITGAPA